MATFPNHCCEYSEREIALPVEFRRPIRSDHFDPGPRCCPIANKAGISDRPSPPGDDTDVSAAAYLEGLNSEQRHAVEHGVAELEGSFGGPLLVIAGAGSGKTNTLAHRVAHLIVRGADPRRILLMTFPRPQATRVRNSGPGAIQAYPSEAGQNRAVGQRSAQTDHVFSST